MKRITVIMPDEVYDKVIALAKKEKRKKSPMAAMLIEDGLKMVEKNETKPFTMADMLNIESPKMSEDDIVNAVIAGLNKK